MKTLKILLGVLAVLVLGFFAFGLLNPTVEYSTQVEVNKPLAESWAVFSDQEKLPRWIEGLQGVEVLEGEMDEPGSKYLVKMEIDGQKMEMTETLVAHEKEKRHAMHFEGEGFSQDVDVQFTTKGENTTVINVNSKMQGDGIFLKSLFAIMDLGGTFSNTTDEMYGRLKTLIEENTTDYSPVPSVEADATMPEVEAEAAAQEQVQ